MKIEGTVRLGTVQKDGDGGNSDVGEPKRHQHQTPPRQVERSGLRERHYRLKSRIKQSVLPVFLARLPLRLKNHCNARGLISDFRFVRGETTVSFALFA
jgi:hypothetical protein